MKRLIWIAVGVAALVPAGIGIVGNDVFSERVAVQVPQSAQLVSAVTERATGDPTSHPTGATSDPTGATSDPTGATSHPTGATSHPTGATSRGDDRGGQRPRLSRVEAGDDRGGSDHRGPESAGRGHGSDDR